MNYMRLFGIAIIFTALGLGSAGGCGGDGVGEETLESIEEPPAEEVVNVTEPVLLTPVGDGVIQQNNPAIDCDFDPFRGYGFEVFFDWSNSESPNGIMGYHIFVMQENALFPLINRFVPESELIFTGCNSFVIDSNLNNWFWAVEAVDNTGILSPAVTDVFGFEPCRLVNGAPCSAP